jgi:Fe-Mn family superoxide dismutase
MSRTLKQIYAEQEFNLSGLNGISDKQLDVHLDLYRGYVKNTNLLNEQIADLIIKGKAGSPEFTDLKRHLGFEYSGKRLHEYYFGNLASGISNPPKGSPLSSLIDRSFGRYENWKKEFVQVGMVRGVGWAILFQDPSTGDLSNHWITLHEDGHPVGFRPILVMDVWEHAFMVDYKPTDRAKYIEAFFSNIAWEKVESRLIAPLAANRSASRR